MQKSRRSWNSRRRNVVPLRLSRHHQPGSISPHLRAPSFVRPVSAHCGIEYHGGRWSAGPGHARTYVHGVPKQRLHGELYDRFVEHGCKQYNISADELEEALKDLIVRERTSDEYERDVRTILQEKEGFKANAREAVAVAEACVESLSAEYRRVVRLATAAGERGLDEAACFDELQRIQQRMAAARRELEEAQEFARSRQGVAGSNPAVPTVVS